MSLLHNLPLIKDTKTQASKRTLDLVEQIIQYLPDTPVDEFVLGGSKPLSYTQVRKMCERIRKEIGFDEPISPIRFRTTVLTDLYDTTKDIKQAQAAAGHTTAAMTLKHYVKGRHERQNTAAPIADAYGLAN
ncbi:MAG: site-specific integrase [Clostridia bacterium]|nr:site-specific integrase [Clostridia bacterium]